jgi:hypothetical protein
MESMPGKGPASTPGSISVDPGANFFLFAIDFYNSITIIGTHSRRVLTNQERRSLFTLPDAGKPVVRAANGAVNPAG